MAIRAYDEIADMVVVDTGVLYATQLILRNGSPLVLRCDLPVPLYRDGTSLGSQSIFQMVQQIELHLHSSVL